jgi:hypothetical protein
MKDRRTAMADWEDRHRWNCHEGQNCYSRKKRLKFDAFDTAGCLPRNAGFSDMDAITEIGGRGLLMEWKHPGAPILEAQRLLLLRLTKDRFLTAIFVWGDAETMTVERYWVFWNGKQLDPVVGGFDKLCGRIKGWSRWAEANSLLPDRRGA